MARLSLVALLTLAFSGVAFATPVDSDLRARDSVPFLSCPDTTRGFLTGVDVSPYPPMPGTQATVTVTAYTHQEVVQNSYATVEVRRGVEPLWTQNVNICETVTCPIPAESSYSFSFIVIMPRNIPTKEINLFTEGHIPSEPILLFCAEIKPAGQ